MVPTWVRTNVMAQFAMGNVDNVLDYEKKYGSDYKLDITYAICHLIKGDVLRSFNKLKVVDNNYESEDEAKEIANSWIQRFKNCGLASLDLQEPNDFTRVQSIEKTNEEYPELERFNRVVKERNELELERFFSQLNIERRSNNPIESALAQFITAEMCVLKEDYENAVSIYISAIRCDYNKALYWGYCGQVMNTYLKLDPFICLYFMNNAIRLDSKNPRWYYLKSIILMRLLFTEQFNPLLSRMFFGEAKNSHINAINLCRNDQQSLKNTVISAYKYIETLEEQLEL